MLHNPYKIEIKQKPTQGDAEEPIPETEPSALERLPGEAEQAYYRRIFPTHSHLRDSVIEQTRYYVPSTEPVPVFGARRFDCKIGFIGSRELAISLNHETQIKLITEELANSPDELGDIDLLIVETFWESATGDWRMAMVENKANRTKLAEIVKWAKDKNIPTALWNTWDVEYLAHVKDFAKHFDAVFCSDPRVTKEFGKQIKQCVTLEPFFQPRLFHPFHWNTHKKTTPTRVIYDGWYDLLKLPSITNALETVEPDRLSVIETALRLRKSQHQRTDERFQPSVLGCVHSVDLPQVLRDADCYLSFSDTFRSRTIQIEKALQAAACRLPCVHYGELDKDDLRREFVLSVSEEKDLGVELTRFEKDPVYAGQIAQRGWRNVFSEHTIANRLNTIFSVLGLKQAWVEYPKATLISPTIRPDMVDLIIKNYEQQTYPAKELAIVVNGNGNDLKKAETKLGRLKQRPDIRITLVPRDFHAGTALNAGIALSSGEYCFRMDDDDEYGPNYLMDTMLAYRAINADFSGKEFTHFAIEGEDSVYKRKNKSAPPSVFYARDLDYGKIGLAGCSLGGRRDFFLKFPYPNDNFGSVDADWSLDVKDSAPETVALCLDNRNLVVNRSTDGSNHTWPVDLQKLCSNSEIISFNSDDIHLD